MTKQIYALATNGDESAWHICSCERCPYAFAKYDSGETSVDWKLLRAARSAFGRLPQPKRKLSSMNISRDFPKL